MSKRAVQLLDEVWLFDLGMTAKTLVVSVEYVDSDRAIVSVLRPRPKSARVHG